jgi:hypothetical protein
MDVSANPLTKDTPTLYGHAVYDRPGDLIGNARRTY